MLFWLTHFTRPSSRKFSMDFQVRLLFLFKSKNLFNRSDSSGFTLLEFLVTFAVISILVALAVPSWLAFVDTCRLNTSQSQLYFGMRQAQRQATKEKISWQITIREKNGRIQWLTHQADAKQFIPDGVKNNDYLWHNLERNVRVYQLQNNKGKYETTLPKQGSQPVWRVIFNYQGCPVYQVGDECTSTSLRTLGQITLYAQNSGSVQRCVYISTILGAMRMGKNHPMGNESSKYCY